MTLAIHERTIRASQCEACGGSFSHVTGFVNDAGGPYAVYFAACHGHPEHEAQIDVVLGTWGTSERVSDHVMFSCRLRSDGAMAVDAPVAVGSDASRLGHLMTRGEALAHPRISEFWSVINLLSAFDPAVYASVRKSSEG